MMSHEQLEHISIIIEIVAFFFVTIDLYGKERLNNLRGRINSINVTGVIAKSKYTLSRIVWVFLITAFLVLLSYYVTANYVSHFTHMPTSHEIEILMRKRRMIFIFSWALMAAFFSTVNDLNKYLLSFTLAIMTFMLYVVKKVAYLFPIEGTMLTIGTILFVTAKLMLYFSI